MNGLYFDFEQNDIVLNEGSFKTALIDSQNCALIALSQVCRITKPEVGAQLAALLTNAPRSRARSYISSAERMVQRDGGRNVAITLDTNDQLQFYAEYADI